MADGSCGNESEAVEARIRLALARSGCQLTENERELLRARIERQMALVRQLLAVPLENGDEPAQLFNPARLALPAASDSTA